MAKRKLFVASATPAGARKPIPVKHVTNVKSGQQGVVEIDGSGRAKQILFDTVLTHLPVHPAVANGLPLLYNAAKAYNAKAAPDKRLNVENAVRAFRSKPMPSKFSNGDVMNASYGLSKAPNPKPVTLNSGIVPNTYSNDYMMPEEGKCSPLHVSHVLPFISKDVTNPIFNYFQNTIAFDVQTRAQANIGFTLDLLAFSPNKIQDAFNSGLYALHVYYFYASVLSYASDPRNKNQGMIAIRQIMSSQLISDLTLLGRRLEDTPMPPRMVEWVRYLNMNFLSGDSQGAPLLKFGCDVTCLSSVSSPTLPALALTGLMTNNNIAVFTLLRRAIPQWRIGTLYDVPVVPVYDKNFLTIWANAPSILYSGVTAVSYPTVANSSTTISYNSYHNRLDGAAYAMTSCWDSVSWIPGLIKPLASSSGGIDSRRSYYSVSGVSGFYNAPDKDYLAISRPESFQSPGSSNLTSSPFTPHLPGADKCQGVSSSSLVQTAQNFLDFLIDVNKIPVNGGLNSFNRKGNNKI